jgi:uncharacterized protein YqjF (DUF2071 family)
MNPLPENPLLAPPAPRPAPGRLHGLRLQADWRHFVFAHFSLPAELLAPHVPFQLETYEGRAYVSLVFFTLERMQVAGAGPASRWLLRPISDHPFLNVRTYVVHEGRPGICFLAEWIPNLLSRFLGPLTYGLPYRLGAFTRELRPADGVGRIGLREARHPAELTLTFPILGSPAAPSAPGSIDEFLLERDTAYTFRGKVRRRFEVRHEPWQTTRADWLRFDTGLIARTFPWFRAATFHSAHLSDGVRNVEMSRPRRLAADHGR